MSATVLSTDAATELATYAYSYPHKSSYRPLLPAVPISDAWRDEPTDGLSLYVHIPFCEMRCGFCNLFTQSQPESNVVDAYLATLERQMQVVQGAIPAAKFSQFAIGGGTPTFLEASQLERLLRQIETTFGQSVGSLSTSVEVSPATTTQDRLQVFAEFGVQRISIGVQSFLTAEAHHLGRPQRAARVDTALQSIREARFLILNIDLIYGDPLQTAESWLYSLREALQYQPEEFYLYPLYIRPATGLGRQPDHHVQHRLDLYQAGRDFLLDHGYDQLSLRCFRQQNIRAPDTGCQRDGMIGLGCGARSYTRGLHYSSKFAVTQAGIRTILHDWIAQSDHDLSLATHGIWLSPEEQQRRYIILSLLQSEGLQVANFRQQFPQADLDELLQPAALFSRGWLAQDESTYRLTELGLQNSDILGPLLYSTAVREQLQRFISKSRAVELEV